MEIDNLFDYLKTETEDKTKTDLVEEDCCENKELVTKWPNDMHKLWRNKL